MEAEEEAQAASQDSIRPPNLRSNTGLPPEIKSTFKIPFVKFDLKTDSLN